MCRTRDLRRSDFAWLTAIEQRELIAAIEHLFDGADVDVEGDKHGLEKVQSPRSNVQSWALRSTPFDVQHSSLPSPNPYPLPWPPSIHSSLVNLPWTWSAVCAP